MRSRTSLHLQVCEGCRLGLLGGKEVPIKVPISPGQAACLAGGGLNSH
jgi:hypothetical protein